MMHGVIFGFKTRSFRIFILCIFLFCGCNDAKQDAAELEDIITKVNKKCPVLLDSETLFEGIEMRNEKTMQYSYTLVHASAQAIDTHQFYLDMRPGILSTIRISPEMQKLRDNKLNIWYDYKDRYHQPVYTFKISPKDYMK